ncbi:uncharacterized protein LOC106636670 isoform X2 [Copidosoma floridanum]|uniref:uncharacterized protein LOC106636670 isoform X2 n=1 Tax=Copidosoma floridanum TaxID=29053 RepID=UPI0006C94934|nr:uncharacterized protein LOC106636670 isoform X2 [Copidosoma floridanum]
MPTAASGNWSWLTGGWANMADLAERVDDLICSFDSSAGGTMDTLSMLVFGWMLLGLVILCVGKFIYNRVHLQRSKATGAVGGTPSGASSGTGSAAGGGGAPAGLHHRANVAAAPVAKADASHTTAAGLHAIGESVALVGAGSSATGVAAAVARSRSVNASRSHVATGGLTTSTSFGGGGGGSSYVPPTPPLRKRVTRKNSGPLVSPGRSSRSLHLPAATGPDTDAVRWTNDMILWLHTDLVVLDEILAVWINSLNDFVASSVNEHGIGIEFVRVLPETHPPVLSNIFCECNSKDDVTITCDCEATPALQLKSFRQQGEKIEASHYRVNVNRFRARLNIFCITEKLLVDLKCDGWPEIKVSLAQVGAIKKDLDESQMQDLLTEIVIGAIRSTSLHLNLSNYVNCPRLWRESMNPTGGYSMPGQYDPMGSGSAIDRLQPQQRHGQLQSSASTIQQYAPGERRLLVKVVRAADLAGDKECREPYCTVEVDEPPQRHQTAMKKETKSPVWDEAFLFDISHNTTEVLLEVYDRVNKSDRFLGLGIVGVEELLANPSQRQIIPLQSRPYEEDEVTGTLTVEFLFIEGAEVPQIGNKPYKVKETIKPPSSPMRGYNPSTSGLVQQQPGNPNSPSYGNNGNSTLILYDSANEPGADFLTNGTSMDSPYRSGQTNGNKGTLIVHSQQRPAERQIVRLEDKDLRSTLGHDSTANSSNSDVDRGRTRKKRRDFFGTIKKRLGRSKTRSSSVGPDGDPNHEDAHSRSISADRARDGRDEHSRRSSISEVSVVSGLSSKTYVNEASTLVLETLENGIRKHYLVPLSLAQKSKWKKKGTKLHIYNDHTFIAKHISGGTTCDVCKRTLARRLGKQGYECRDCLMKCHKHCHVKVESMCPTTTIQSIELSLLPVLNE